MATHNNKQRIIRECQLVVDFMFKYLRKKGNKSYLKPANPNYKDIYPESEFKIVGVVTGSVRKF